MNRVKILFLLLFFQIQFYAQIVEDDSTQYRRMEYFRAVSGWSFK